MNRITDELYVSDAQSVRNLPENHNFDYIITLGYYDGLGYERPELTDTGDEFVFPDHEDHDYADFKAACDETMRALDDPDNDRVLVHCQAGCSRSPAVCIAVVAVRENLHYDDAYWNVKQARGTTNPIPELEASAKRWIREHRPSDE